MFVGDSITAARGIPRSWNFTLMRYPERRVKFWNAGRGGDTAAGQLRGWSAMCSRTGDGGDGGVWRE